MKKALVASLLLILLVFASCTATVEKAENQDGKSMFIKVEGADAWNIVYHKKTKVMYAVSDGAYNRGTFTLLVNADGTPLIYGEKMEGDTE